MMMVSSIRLGKVEEKIQIPNKETEKKEKSLPMN
tara:strand:- start:397 stop:498 length:102 start_codon:yes stop_codon:yes gene_type:complete